ncbi:hypothetical protein KFE98_15535 [bacterium SCSIO 12741]|nr:hypothetical protein KFE98_15535 [bacterium SCSIO 12741]
MQDNFEAGRRYNIYSEIDAYAPGFIMAHKNMGFGLNIRVRNHFIARRMPSDLMKFIDEGWNFTDQHDIDYDADNFYAKNFTWGEIGLNYGQIVYKRGDQIIQAGGSLKILSGISSIGILSDNLNYRVDSSNVTFNEFTGKIAITDPGFNIGMGMGLDLGIVYKKMINDNNTFYLPHSKMSKCKINPYKYKIGVSLLDLGFLRFTKSSNHYTFENDSAVFVDHENFNIDWPTDINRLIEESGSNPTQKTKFTSTLPLALSAQFDYNFENNIYVNATLLMGFRQSNFMGGDRITQFTVTPRYEHRFITVGLPVTVFRYQAPGVGLHARLWWLTLGTNNFLPFLFSYDAYGADAYFSLNVPIFHSGKCKEYERKKSDYCPKPRRKINIKGWFKKKRKT